MVLLFCFVLFFLMAYGIRRHTALWDSFAFVDLPPSSFLGSALLVVVVFFRGRLNGVNLYLCLRSLLFFGGLDTCRF